MTNSHQLHEYIIRKQCINEIKQNDEFYYLPQFGITLTSVNVFILWPCSETRYIADNDRTYHIKYFVYYYITLCYVII